MTNGTCRHRVKLDDGSCVIVARLGIFSDVGGWRRQFAYSVHDQAGDLVVKGFDLYGPCGAWTDAEAPSARSMAGSLLSFLEAAGDHYRAAVMWQSAEYRPWFTEQADAWCYQVDSELQLARLEIER